MEMDVYPAGRSAWPTNFVLAHFFIFLLQGLQCREYCNVDTFQADCGGHQVILVTSAKYGRMRIGQCIQQDLGHVGCHVDVLAQLDAQCSGRKRCEIPNVDAAMRGLQACSELVKYLDASYKCIPVMSVNRHQCRTIRAIFAPPPPGHLANVVTMETECGGQGNPWVIEVDVTKRINITLVDFGRLQTRQDSECVEYGLIREPGRQGLTRICGGKARMRPVFLSQGHRVEITLKSPDEISQTYFLIHYEAVGCPTPPIAMNMWLKQDNGHVIVGCESSPTSWKLTCEGDKWLGHMGNCTGASQGGSSGDDAVTAFFKSLPRDIMIYVIVGLCVLLLLCGIIAVMACTRRFCPKEDTPDVYELAVRGGGHPVAMRAQQQTTAPPQQTTVLTNTGLQATPVIQRHPVDEPRTEYPQPRRTPPKPAPRRTLARRGDSIEDRGADNQPNRPTAPSLASATPPSRVWTRRPDDTVGHNSPGERHSARRRPEQRRHDHTDGSVRKPRPYPSATSRSKGRPEPSAPVVADMGFV